MLFSEGRMTVKGWMWLQAYTLTIIGVVSVFWLTAHKVDGDGTSSTIVTVLGFLSVIILGLYNGAKVEENKRVAVDKAEENKQLLGDIKNKVNGATDALLAEQAAKHQAEIKALEALSADDRHKRDNEINTLRLQLSVLTGDYKVLQEKYETAIKKDS